MRWILPALLPLLTAPLQAQPFALNGGLQVGFNHLTGDAQDLRDVGTHREGGGHFGGHLDFNFTRHHQLRAHITGYEWTGNRWGGYWDPRNDLGVLQVGAEWVYNFGLPNRGAYFLVGGSINRVRSEYDALGYASTVTQDGRPGFRVGGGYNFNRWFSLEGSSSRVSVDKYGADGLGYDELTWFSVSAVFRFGR